MRTMQPSHYTQADLDTSEEEWLEPAAAPIWYCFPCDDCGATIRIGHDTEVNTVIRHGEGEAALIQPLYDNDDTRFERWLASLHAYERLRPTG